MEHESGEDPEAGGELPEALDVPAVAARSVDPSQSVIINTKGAAPRELETSKRTGIRRAVQYCRTTFQGGTTEKIRDLMKG